jgi:hypothetical protein
MGQSGGQGKSNHSSCTVWLSRGGVGVPMQKQKTIVFCCWQWFKLDQGTDRCWGANGSSSSIGEGRGPAGAVCGLSGPTQAEAAGGS